MGSVVSGIVGGQPRPQQATALDPNLFQNRLAGRRGRGGEGAPSGRGERPGFIGRPIFKPKDKTPAPTAPSILDPSVSASVRRRKASATAAAGSTILTGSQGLTGEASTTKKSLLGT